MQRPLLAACLIVRNEAAQLARCLRSLTGVADEIVVVDTGSDDDTVRIARGFERTRVFSLAWTDDFAAARNESIVRTGADWILVVDADEEVLAPAGFRDALPTRPEAGLLVRIENLQPAGALTRSEELEVVRLFRNDPAHRFEGRIHEQVAPSIRRRGGRIGRSDLLIRHHGYAEPVVQGADRREERNRRLIERELADRPDDYYLHYQLGATLKAQDPVRARAALERCLELAPPDASRHVLEQAHTKLAQLALERGDLVPCATYAAEGVAYNEANVTARVCSIVSTASLGRLDLARPHLEWMVEHALDRVPNPDDFRVLLAQARGGKPR